MEDKTSHRTDKAASEKPYRHPLSALNPAQLPALNGTMKVEITVNQDSDVWLLHDAPLSNLVKWVEYDCQQNRVMLVVVSGQYQDIGIVIPDPMRPLLRSARQIFIMQVRDGDIVDFSMVPLIARDFAFN